MLNIIHTDAEYLALGFSEKEIPLIRRHDELFNQRKINGFLKPHKEAEMFELAKRLDL